jgi:hypothetical protein
MKAVGYFVISVMIVTAIVLASAGFVVFSGRVAELRPPPSASLRDRLRPLTSDCSNGVLFALKKQSDKVVVPPVSDAEMLSWASMTIPRLMTFGYSDFYNRLHDERDSFSADGWCGFLNALMASDLLPAVVDWHLKLSLVFLGNLQIEGASSADGAYEWRLKAPVALELTGGLPPGVSPTTTNELTVTVSHELSASSPPSDLRITQITLLPLRQSVNTTRH